jgi:hypothetical protein
MRRRPSAAAMSAFTQIELFTTNYDLLLEEALEYYRAPFFDGFVGSRRPFFDLAAIENDQFPTRWMKLWKLHGSINWVSSERGAARTTQETGGNLLVYPSHLKYDESRRLPYTAMMDRLLSFLRKEHAILISLGFSFADSHISELIQSGLRANGNASVIALMHGGLDEADYAAQIALVSPQFSLIARDGQVVDTITCDWDGSSVSDNPPAWSMLARPGGDKVEFTGGDFQVFCSHLGQLANIRDMGPSRSDEIDPSFDEGSW